MKLEPRVSTMMLQGYESDFRSGKVKSALDALVHCLRQGETVPDWAADHFLRAYANWQGLQKATLDEALGFKPITKKRLATLRKRRLDEVRVWNAVTDAHRAGAIINTALFASVGRKLHLSGGTVSRRWTAAKARMANLESDSAMRMATAALLAPFAASPDVVTSQRRRRKR